MAFNTTVFSTDGLNLLSQLSSTKSLRIKNIYVDEIEHAASDFHQLPSWWASQTSSTMAKVDAELSAASVISDQARLVVKLRLKQSETTTVTAKTVVITACGVESGVESTEITFCGISDSAGVEVLYNASNIKLSTSVAIYFAFNSTSEITFEDAIDPDFVIHSELDRFVSCHPIGDPTGGEAQTVGGVKTFKDGAVIDIADSSKLSFHHSGDERGWIGDTGTTGLQFTSTSNTPGDTCFQFSNGDTPVVTISLAAGAASSYYLDVDGTVNAESVIATTLKGTSVETGSCKIDDTTLASMYDGLCIDGNFTPKVDRTFYLGKQSCRWATIFGYEMRSTMGLAIDSQDAYNNTLHIYEDEGDICLGGLLTGHGFMVGQMYDTSTNSWGERGSIHCGKMYGSLVTTEYKPTASIPTIPNSAAQTDAPTFTTVSKMIVMAIPCWATCRSLFLNRRAAGETITVKAPTGVPPYIHSGTSTDPEDGAWFVATWKCGKNSTMGHYEPLSTLDPSTNRKLYSYLPAGQYRLLNCVDEITSLNYSDYNPNGMCLMLQKV